MTVFNTTLVVYNGNEIHVPAADDVTASLAKYGIVVNEPQLSHIQRYIACLVFWNQRVSLTSVSNPEEMIERHFAESLLATPLITSQEGRLADVGSGPGFPGLALKIAVPSLQVLLIDRNTKKCAFLNEVIRFLNLDLVTVIRSDYASISPDQVKFDYITARALRVDKEFLRWSAGKLAPGGEIILWLGAPDSIKLSQSKSWRWDPPIPIPHSQRRVILVGRPIF